MYMCICVCIYIYIYIYIYICMYVCMYMKSLDAKPSKCHLIFSCKISIFSQASMFLFSYLTLMAMTSTYSLPFKVKLLHLHICWRVSAKVFPLK